MVVTKILGGLGNQMFQYAFGRANALRGNTQLFLDRRGFAGYETHSFGLQHLNTEIHDAPDAMLLMLQGRGRINRLLRRFLPGRASVYVEQGFQFDPLATQLRGDFYFEGYWQSEKYFIEFAPVIRRELQVKTPPSDANQHWLDLIGKVNAVSIHVRRGDYVTSPAASQTHGTCGLDYYNAAVTQMQNGLSDPPVFFVFSDDHEWVRCNMSFAGEEHYFVTTNDAETNYEDLRLMSACKHHIIANSTFSWWGAWLNPNQDKIVIAPKRWFVTDQLCADDLIPSGWHLL
jgi:hypothetical protein